MDRKNKLHYHIRWSSKEVLDWQAFDSKVEAEARAAELVRFGETYTIEEHGLGCPKCSTFQSKTAQPPYPWQQAVLDAVSAPPEQRMRKINEAQRAIAARHLTLTPSDLQEQAAIRDALRTLRELIEERKKAETDSGKTEVA